MAIKRIFLSGIKSMQDFHDLVQSTLEFPRYYGRNLDAFWDCLTDLPRNTRIEFIGLERLPQSLQIEVNRYREVLKEFQETGWDNV